MKILTILLTVLISGSCATSQKTYTKRFTKEDRKFIKAVTGYEKEALISATKRKDSHIVLEFSSTVYILAPTGYVDEVWILVDEIWNNLGTEKDAY